MLTKRFHIITISTVCIMYPRILARNDWPKEITPKKERYEVLWLDTFWWKVLKLIIITYPRVINILNSTYLIHVFSHQDGKLEKSVEINMVYPFGSNNFPPITQLKVFEKLIRYKHVWCLLISSEHVSCKDNTTKKCPHSTL